MKVPLFVALLALLPAGAGCLGATDRLPPGPEVVLPPVGNPNLPPGPYREHAADLNEFSSFFTKEVPTLLPCVGEPNQGWFVQDVAAERYHRLVDTFTNACWESIEANAWDLVNETIDTGNENATIQHLRTRAFETIDALGENLRMIQPGNHVELEFVSSLAGYYFIFQQAKHLQGIETYENADNGVPPTEAESARRLALLRLYRGPLGAMAWANATLTILGAYPWSGGSCDLAPHLAPVHARVQRLEAAMQAVDSRNSSNVWLIRYEWDVWDPYTFFRERDWDLGIIARDNLARIYETYLLVMDRPEVWPSLEEAEGMLATLRSDHRTIQTEFRWDDILYSFDERRHILVREWQDPQDGAAWITAHLAAMHWSYEGVQCVGRESTHQAPVT